MANNLPPPPPTGQPIDRWLNLLWKKIAGAGQVLWSQIGTTGTADFDGNVTVAGNTTLGNATSDTITFTGTIQPGAIISGSSSSDALRITQTGAGNALVIEDSTNPDSTPFVVSADGNVGIGTTAPSVKLDSVGGIAFGVPVTVAAATHTVAVTTTHLIINNAGTCTLTLPAAASFSGRILYVRTITANTVVSASSNISIDGGAAGTAILAATVGKWAMLVSDGTNWVVQANN